MFYREQSFQCSCADRLVCKIHSSPGLIGLKSPCGAQAVVCERFDITAANAQVRTLNETIRLDSRTKLLNPKWYEGMLDSGYEGVREVAKRLNFTLGWSATSGSVDNFVYEEANETFINDPEMRKRLMDLNPHSFRRIVGTLLEVNGRGYWETSDENIQQLQELYQEVEDRIEGVVTD